LPKKIEILLILLTDFIAISLTWCAYYYVRVEAGFVFYAIKPAFLLPGLVIYFYWFLIFLFVGMYRTWFAMSRFDELSTLFKASFVGIFILFFVIFIDDISSPDATTKSRYLIFIYWGLFLFFVGLGRLFIRSLQRYLLIVGYGRKNALIVGFNQRANNLHDQIIRYRALGLDVAGYIATSKEDIGKEYRGIKVLDSIDSIDVINKQLGIKDVIIALDKHYEDVVMNVIYKCDSSSVGIKIVADLYEIISGQARTSLIYGFPLIDIMPELMPEWEKKIKRFMDIVISLLILIITLPITLLTSVAVIIDSSGPLFYRQSRAGMNNKEFSVIKFRSMIKDAEKHTGPVWSHKKDPRITRVGKIIRKLRIDEIPQMYNILKGEMSLVGPRPERPFFVEKLSEEIPLYKKRLKVRPGVTGWAQVKHKYDESIEDVKTKLRYDLFYIENMSLRMDLKIILRTIFVVVFGRGHFN
jgi:exopolysaccharide biosynthesis polyprenyl glycosylphosphotransferase